MSRFKLHSKFRATGDQPQAIKQLCKGLQAGYEHQTLLGVTGSGKTFTMASVMEKMQLPALVISPNKTLAAQLYGEFREFFPENAVHYFVSYYDYYQPEAYIPQTDTYIEKTAQINEEIDRLRHAATQALLTRRDVIIVASVSCIYGLGSPEEYENLSLSIAQGQKINRQEFLASLIDLQYQRNDQEFQRGTFQVKGDIIEIHPVTGDQIIRVEFFGNTIEKIRRVFAKRPQIALTEVRDKFAECPKITIYPAKHYVVPFARQKIALQNIRAELAERIAELKKQKKIVEAQRLQQKTNYDLEMIEETGYCNGIENYSRHFDGRNPGEPPNTLLNFYNMASERPLKFLTFIDESHIAVPQIRGMYFGDQARKKMLVDYGFRLSSAFDNRPLTFAEFNEQASQIIYVSATPQEYEFAQSLSGNRIFKNGGWEKINYAQGIVEQLIRPTGLLDPEIEVRTSDNQIADLISEINKRTRKKQRVLVTTLTKQMSEELADYLLDHDIKVQYLHSEIDTLERTDILRDLRLGKYDVVVGINLLREGLDLPEVSLVAILDADKEGFLRNETTLIQTMGRAARHVEGKVILYADKMSGAMKRAIEETTRRRKTQEEYNKKHKIKPQTIRKGLQRSIIEE